MSGSSLESVGRHFQTLLNYFFHKYLFILSFPFFFCYLFRGEVPSIDATGSSLSEQKLSNCKILHVPAKYLQVSLYMVWWVSGGCL